MPDGILQDLHQDHEQVSGLIEQLTMEQLSLEYGAERRRLRVVKMRGMKYRGGYHDFTIETGGLVIYPRLVAAEHHKAFLGEPTSTGSPELDALLGWRHRARDDDAVRDAVQLEIVVAGRQVVEQHHRAAPTRKKIL